MHAQPGFTPLCLSRHGDVGRRPRLDHATPAPAPARLHPREHLLPSPGRAWLASVLFWVAPFGLHGSTGSQRGSAAAMAACHVLPSPAPLGSPPAAATQSLQGWLASADASDAVHNPAMASTVPVAMPAFIAPATLSGPISAFSMCPLSLCAAAPAAAVAPVILVAPAPAAPPAAPDSAPVIFHRSSTHPRGVPGRPRTVPTLPWPLERQLPPFPVTPGATEPVCTPAVPSAVSVPPPTTSLPVSL